MRKLLNMILGSILKQMVMGQSCSQITAMPCYSPFIGSSPVYLMVIFDMVLIMLVGSLLEVILGMLGGDILIIA